MASRLTAWGLAVAIGITGSPAGAQNETETALEKYRAMMKADPWSNPALLDADRGAALWTTKAGPKGATLDACDLGMGPGRLDGAFAELPRYFADVDRVMDAETRILWCLETLQGFDRAGFLANPHPASGEPVKDVGAIVTYVASKSAGRTFAPKAEHPKEKDTIALGEAIFFRRQGPFDFACATCHADQGRRIRLQALPVLSKPEAAAKVVGEWPAYRVSATHVMTLQHRLLDCYWQMRMHRLEFGSEASVALIAYLTDKARGGEISAPSIKR